MIVQFFLFPWVKLWVFRLKSLRFKLTNIYSSLPYTTPQTIAVKVSPQGPTVEAGSLCDYKDSSSTDLQLKPVKESIA